MGANESKAELLARARDPATPPADRVGTLLTLTYNELDASADRRRECEEQRRRVSERHSAALARLMQADQERRQVEACLQALEQRHLALEKRMQALKAIEADPPLGDAEAMSAGLDAALVGLPWPPTPVAASSFDDARDPTSLALVPVGRP